MKGDNKLVYAPNEQSQALDSGELALGEEDIHSIARGHSFGIIGKPVFSVYCDCAADNSIRVVGAVKWLDEYEMHEGHTLLLNQIKSVLCIFQLPRLVGHLCARLGSAGHLLIMLPDCLRSRSGGSFVCDTTASAREYMWLLYW